MSSQLWPRQMPLTADESVNITSVNLTAAMLADGRVRRGSEAALSALDENVPMNNVSANGLFFVHGHRHREEWSLHAGFLSLSEWAKSTHVLIFCTDVTISTAWLMRRLALYPQAVKLLIHTGINIGYRCGLLHSIAATRRVWARYSFVVFTHPDVFLLQPAPAELERAVAIDTDVALLATPTKMFWYGKRRGGAFLSDLFVFRPARLPGADGREVHAKTFAEPLAGTRTWDAYWGSASVACISSYWRRRQLLKPEQALHEVREALNASFVTLPLVRSESGTRNQWQRGRPSRSGVWHTHNTSQVSKAWARLSHGLSAESKMVGVRGC